MNWEEFFRCEMLGLLALFPLPGGFGGGLDDAAFFCHTRAFLLQSIFEQAAAASERIARAIAMLSTTIVTGWVLFHGVGLVSGTHRQPATVLLMSAIKLVVIVALINLTLNSTNDITAFVLSFQDLITQAVVGGDGSSVRTMVDINLFIAQAINQMVESMVGGGQAGVESNRLTNVAGLLGQSGPAMITAVMVMLAEIAIAFGLMLTPLFLFFLLFKATSSLFWSWVKFLMGAFFSLAALALVSGVVLNITASYGLAVALAIFANGGEATGGTVDISGSGMRLAALGALMSAVVVSVPPMIMQFFNAGVGFAAGAMGGMMGGAMAGRMAGGGTGVPGMVYGGAGGSGGGAGGSASGAGPSQGGQPGLPSPGQTAGESHGGPSGNSTTHQLLSRANGGLSGDEPEGRARPSGMLGHNSEHGRTSAIRDQQWGSGRSNFRSEDAYVAEMADRHGLGNRSALDRSDADIRSRAGGSARPDETNNSASGARQTHANREEGADGGSSTPTRGGENPDTSVHRTPPPGATPTPSAQSETATRPQVPWDQRNTEGVRS
ncbi:MAG: hypothetical protein CVU22_04220 [Betaproteobacteria bacterium HGW-Betaproteobacteria-16]|nr:MAG: hypothetical protein CVU22_04220 [Betaproteobacteria bacterium HGW-Betaproteobacteria-16]